MKCMNNEATKIDLYEFSKEIKNLSEAGSYEKAKELICMKMAQYPDAAEPHNLYGIILEKERDGVGAMKHFRAAWALDPTYIPARQNMERFGSFTPTVPEAYNEDDCEPENSKKKYKLEYDQRGIGHIVRRGNFR